MSEMTTTLALIGMAAFFLAAAIATGVIHTVISERRQVNRTLRAARTIDLDPHDLGRRELAVPFFSRVGEPTIRRATALARRISPDGLAERLDQELAFAGYPSGWDAARVLAFKVIIPVSLVLLMIVFTPLAGWRIFSVALAVPVVAFLGWMVPDLIVRSKAKTRQKDIQRSLADAIDLLAITVEAGLGFDAALSRVSGEVRGPLGEELHRVVQEIRLGSPRSDALRNLAERNSVSELRTFVMSMIQADLLGIRIGTVLEIQAKEIRLQRRQRAEEKAMKLPVKIVFPVVLFIFPALFVVILGPAGIMIVENLFGDSGVM
jgi:tight adherence protein C